MNLNDEMIWDAMQVSIYFNYALVLAYNCDGAADAQVSIRQDFILIMIRMKWCDVIQMNEMMWFELIHLHIYISAPAQS